MKKTKYILLLLITLVMVLSLAACGGKGEDPNKPSDNPENPKTIWDRDEVNSKITVGLRNAGNSINEQADGTRHVLSRYDLLIDVVNMTFYYEANYNLTRAQDSEILFRVFNNQFEANELFVYYNEGTLYYEVGGNKHRINNFGNTSNFDSFYKAMKTIDAGGYYFSEDFAYYLTSGIPVTRNISIIPIGNNKESILFTDVNLNVAVIPVIGENGLPSTINIREYINGLIKDYAGLIGDSFDALSNYLIGFDLSILKNVEIGVINLDELTIINDNNTTSAINLSISGKQADNIGTFNLGFAYENDKNTAPIKLKKTEDPYYMVEDINAAGNHKPANNYKPMQLGQIHLKGNMYIPYLGIDETHPFNVEIKADLTSADNDQNLLYIDIRDRTSDNLSGSNYYVNKSIALICYENGKAYIDLEGMRNLYLGNGIALWQLLDVPGGANQSDKLAFRFDDMDISKEIGMLFDFIVSLLIGVEVDQGSILDLFSYQRLASMLSFISSDGSKIVLNLNDQLLGQLIGDDSANIVGWLAKELGISETIIQSVVGTGVLNDISLKLFFDTATSEIGITLLNGRDTIFHFSLFTQDVPEQGLDIDFPAEYFTNTYYTIKEPEAVSLELNGIITKQGATAVDMSAFMGAFIGDVTGENTPYEMTISDILSLKVNVTQTSDKTYVKALLSKGKKNTPIENYTAIMELYTIMSGTSEQGYSIGEVYCDNHILGVQYAMTLQGLMDAFGELLGDDNIFTVDGVMNVVNMLSEGASLTFNEQDIAFRLAPYEKNGVSYDPIYELIGLRSLIADMTAKVRFESGGDYNNAQYIFGANFDADAYPVPQIAQLPNVRFESIYEATWHDSVKVTFGNTQQILKLSFLGDSAKLVSNRYDYYPEAKLFGEVLSYTLVLTDVHNGTKVISELAISKLSINPIEDQPIPTKIRVLYDDGNFGELAFEIVGFPYSANTIGTALQGLALKNYTIIIGKDSIAERRFVLPIEVLNRIIIPLVLLDNNGEPTSKYNDVPIVATMSIDPYDYMLKKQANSAYNPVDPVGTFYLYFKALDESLGDTRINILNDPLYANFSWNFDESAISFRGGTYHAIADYYSLKIAIQITVKARIFDYIKVYQKDPDHGYIEEANGNYTIDALLPESYAMPSVTDSRAEVRIYFKTGNYRVIGNGEGVVPSDICDGAFPHSLIWNYVANNIDIDGTTAPLLSGTTNINKGTFAKEDVGFKRFEQSISLIVNCPPRRLDLLADAVRSEVDRDGAGTSVMGDIKINKIAFAYSPTVSDKEEDYGRFNYNPIAAAAESKLPSYIYLPVQYAGVYMLRRYPVTWHESSLLDRNGNLRYPSADEIYVKAEGTIGSQKATIAIHNIKAPYKLDIPNPNAGNAIITQEEGGIYLLNINPYDNYQLPTFITVKYIQTGVNQTFGNIVWYRTNEQGAMVDIDANYKFPYQGGDFIIYAYIQKDAAAGILAQTVPLKVRVEKMLLNSNDEGNYSANGLDVGLGCLADGTGQKYVSIDTYAASSLTLLNKLESGVDTLVLNFIDGNGNAATKSGMLVTWDTGSIEGLIAALKSPLGSSTQPNGYIELNGVIFKGTYIQQSIKYVYKIDAQEFNSINFVNLDTYYTKQASEITASDVLADASRYDVLTIDVNPITKTISVLLKKPYALKGGQRNYALPSQYFSYLLDNISIIISNTSGTRQIPECTAIYDILGYLDTALLNFISNSQVTSADFPVLKLNANSSCEETFTFVVNAVYDVPLQKTLTTNVETLDENGDAKNEYKVIGYPVEQSVSVTYLNSGVIKYGIDNWNIDRHYRAYKLDSSGEVRFDEQNSLMLSDSSVTIIPNALFNSNKGNTITLNTTLPDGTLIYNEIRFLPKNINLTDYQATAATAEYSIGVMGEGGTLVLRDVYAAYPFNPSKLPMIITPNQSSDFNIIAGSSVKFTVDKWIPSNIFGADGTFSEAALKERINSGGLSRILLATATIGTDYPADTCDESGALTEVQTIELYISVAQLYQYLVAHPRLNISVNETVAVEADPNDPTKNFNKTLNYNIVIDPYELDALDRYAVTENGITKYYFRLPTELNATMYSKFVGTTTVSTIAHSFAAGDFTYQVQDASGNWHIMSSLQYSYFGHQLGASFGLPNSVITVRANLKDRMQVDDVFLGQYIEFKIRFLDRTLSQESLVQIQNFTNKDDADGLLTAKYYIDPYNQQTFALPQQATFYFTNGDTKQLDILWKVEDGFPFVTSGGVTTFNPQANQTFFAGGQYLFQSDLSQYGVDAQYYSVNIIVIDRSLVTAYDKQFVFDDINTLYGMASDIPNEVQESDFVQLTDSLYYDYNNIATPIIPTIRWNISDKEIDFINGFKNKEVIGSFTSGNVMGEDARVVISGYKLHYLGITQSVKEDGTVVPFSGSTIEFNSYTNSSADLAFVVQFRKLDENGQLVGIVDITCYSRPFANTDVRKRAVIDWGTVADTDGDIIRVFYICNLFKLDGAPNNRITVSGFKYSFGQMIIDEIDLGYGRNASGLVEFVIDPIYPQIPKTVIAYGKNTLTNRSFVLDNVETVWDSDIHAHTSLAGGLHQISLSLKINGKVVAIFEVMVHYLNRVAQNIYTTDAHYSTQGISEGYYRLLLTDRVSGVRTSYFEIDPIRDAIYDAANKRYKLPTNLKVTYNYNYPVGSTLYKGIMNLGSETFYENMGYDDWRMSADIELWGTAEGQSIILMPYQYTFKYQISGSSSQTVSKPVTHQNNKLDDSYNLSFTVIDRSVSYTSISTSFINEEGQEYQMADTNHEIDPYNPVFPKEISIYFKGREDDPKMYAEGTFEWEYSDDYFSDEDILSGKDPAKLFMWASIKVYGATLNIKFRIKPRYIHVPKYPNGGVIGIDGGTLYVLKGADINTALPKSMYYKFDNEGSIEVAKVPLTFPHSELAKIDTSKDGEVYAGIRARLGRIDDNNIWFNIVIINPVIYNIITTTSSSGGISYSNGSFILDTISVPCNQLGEYNAGQEYLLMPRIVIVEANGGYLEIDYTRTVYDISAQTATFYCKYHFRSTSDRLSGNANGYDEDSAKLTLVFTKKISPYNYNNVSEELFFRNSRGEAVDNYVMNVPLGQKVYSSQMPLAYNSRGDNYSLFWDFSKVNVNKAGDYVATGYYRNQLENNIALSIIVRVDKQKLEPNDVQISNYWLERRYAGAPLSLDDYLTVVTFLREDGSFGNVTYTIGYAFSENGPWITSQPIDVGIYYVRILIEDYNVSDYKIFSFRIRINEIAENEIFYEDNSPEAQTTYTYNSRGVIIARSIAYIYNGTEQRPSLTYTGGGVDILANNLLKYTESCYRYNENSDTWELYTGSIRDVGVYKLVVTINNTQPNFYYSTTNLPIEATIRITKKVVYYSLVDTFVYAGTQVNVPVIVRDAYSVVLDKTQYSDIYNIIANATYIYQQRTLSGWIDLPTGSKVISAGQYRVTVRINGGTNYNSANILLPNGNIDSTSIVDELRDKQFIITKKQVDFRINNVSSYYLDDIMAFSSAVTLTEPAALEDNPAIVKSNINDIIAIMGALNIVVGVGGASFNTTLTQYSVKGQYPLTLISRPNADNIANYEIISFYDGVYEIATPSEAILITSIEQLNNNIESLEDNSSTPYKWYLSANNYGDIVIDKNVNLSIVGAFDEAGLPVVVFESITITKGTVGLDIIRLHAKGNKSTVYVGAKAGTLTVSRSQFVRTGSSYLTNSVAISSEMGYKNAIYINDTSIIGFTAGIMMFSGSINMRNCVLSENISALQVRDGDLELHQNTFSYNKSEAVYIAGSNVSHTLNGNFFISNVIGIKTTVSISTEVANKNTFANNAKNIHKL